MSSIYEWSDRALALPGAPDIWRLAADGKGLVTVDTDEGLYGIASDGTWWEPTGRADRPWVLAVDHPATAGCLLALLGPGWCFQHDEDGWVMWRQFDKQFFYAPTLGRAAIAAAAALGRWPGGNSDWAHEDVAQRAVRLLGTDHPDAGSTMGDLAEALRQLSALRCSLVRPGGSDG